jgi:citrate lyase subunit beta/citryl-CoA lyase
MRSYLFTPSDQIRKLAKARSSGADVVILDLEDSIAWDKKETARRLAFDFLQDQQSQKNRPLFYVRINGLESELAQQDLEHILPARPDAILLPKCHSARDVQHLSVKLSVLEAQNNIEPGATKIMPLTCETAASLFHMGSLINASTRLIALCWGAEDLAFDLGAHHTRQPDGSFTSPMQMARALTLAAARAADIIPIDAVYTDLRNQDGLRQECLRAAKDGFEGKLAIHPDQIDIIHETFSPSPEDLAYAQDIISAFVQNPDQGAIQFEGRMIDRVHLQRAHNLIKRQSGL